MQFFLLCCSFKNELLQQRVGFFSGDNKVLKSGLEEAIIKAENIAEERDDLRNQLEDLRVHTYSVHVIVQFVKYIQFVHIEHCTIYICTVYACIVLCTVCFVS